MKLFGEHRLIRRRWRFESPHLHHNIHHNMNIGFYGHSICTAINTPNNESFIDQIRLKYSANIVSIGVPQGSEERILFDLKKTTNLDIAVIFHSFPKFIFLPRCKRDISINTVPLKKAKYFWTEADYTPVTKERFEEIFFSYGKIKEVFETSENYVDAVTSYREFFYHPDLMTNRYQSTLLMIDNYLSSKKIPSYHVIHPKCLPNWMSIQSGALNTDFLMFPYFSGYNNITLEQNKIIAETLITWIDKNIS